MNVIKTKIYNQLTKKFALCVHMFGQSFFTMHNFPYDEVVGIWQSKMHQYALNA
jgi:uncharacterized protein YfbU (UPF0304 family)